MTATAQELLATRHLDIHLLGQLADEVATVETELRRLIASRTDAVEQVARLTLEAGGKRLRPALVSLCAKATQLPFNSARVVELGAAVEMIHMATLIHDDVIDEARTRRGRPTAAAEFGNTTAILSGDVLLAKAMAILANDADIPTIQAVSNAVVAMSESEVQEVSVRGRFDLSEDEYNAIVGGKTARFVEVCCELGALVTHAPESVRAALRTFGYHVGFAFQIVDDLLDYRGDHRTGKATGTDFRDGQMTLPLIYLRENLSEAEGAIARHRFGNGASEDEIRMIAGWMDTRNAFARCESLAIWHVDTALAALREIPASGSRDVLEAVAEYVLQRRV
ncbi:MAG: polyprenyl synthetase family protein [Fimbriimonadaceae bacterium]|nr:polyprenyl synthetase family protein [Fimbriimonadaceae bacterium]